MDKTWLYTQEIMEQSKNGLLLANPSQEEFNGKHIIYAVSRDSILPRLEKDKTIAEGYYV